jgi:hypothetical protein
MAEPPYADVERMLVVDLAGFGQTGTVLPDGLPDALPFVRTRRIGGTDDGVTDRARVVVDVLAATRGQAWDVARHLQQHMLSGPRAVPGAGIIDRATTDVGPQDAPYEDVRVRLVTATYNVSSRRPRTL